LIVYRNKARDWDDKGYRLGFEGSQALADFRPQWHHVFPKKFLDGKADEEQINALANIAVIGSEINIRVSAKNPMDYLDRYKISDDKLTQQFIPASRKEFQAEKFSDFLQDRAMALAGGANAFLNSLGAE
jgi:hypothetical protein